MLAADEVSRNDLELAPLEPHVLAEALTSFSPATGAATTPSTSWRPPAQRSRSGTLTLAGRKRGGDARRRAGRSPTASSTGWTSDAPRPIGGTGPAWGRDCFNSAEIAFLEHVTELMEYDRQADRQRPAAHYPGRDVPRRCAARPGDPLLAGRRGPCPRRHGLVLGVRLRLGRLRGSSRPLVERDWARLEKPAQAFPAARAGPRDLTTKRPSTGAGEQAFRRGHKRAEARDRPKGTPWSPCSRSSRTTAAPG